MVKAYLRYEQQASFGVITSPSANVIFDSSGKLVVSGSLENVSVWNIKQGALVKDLVQQTQKDYKAEVTQLTRAPNGTHVAVGYADGSIRIWDFLEATCIVTFSGHKSAVTALRYDKAGGLLASGGKDTDIVVWDVAGETGLYRLRGHRDEVTDVLFLDRTGHLVSSSKDSHLRVWQLDTQHCCQTVVGHRGEVWSMDANPEGTRVVTGSTDSSLRCFRVVSAEGGDDGDGDGDGEEGGSGKVLEPCGEVRRAATERVSLLRFSPSGSHLGCLAAGRSVELFKVLGEAEARKRHKRRLKRKQEKSKSKEGDGAEDGEGDGEGGEGGAGGGRVAADEIAAAATVRLKHKAVGFDFSPAPPKSADCQVVVALGNNSLEVHEVASGAPAGGDATRTHQIEMQGHRSDVRALALSGDDQLLLSCSNTAAKIWNPSTGTCLRSVETGYGLSCCFVPGGRHAVVGTKAGAVEVIDVGAATNLTSIDAHEGAVWTVAPLPDGSGVVTGSADHEVKFWEYELTTPSPEGEDGEDDEEGGKKKKKKKKSKKDGAAQGEGGAVAQTLGLRHVRTLKMTDDVLSVRFSPDGKLLAVALLDSTVKVFFADSLKFFLSLYGHKLPVLCQDISSDGSLIITGSADKNVKIWGLDFGDCHRSLFAHQDSVMQVSFVKKTHYFFSCGKDRTLKYWDADKFQLLLTLDGHHSEVWGLAVSTLGDFVVTGGHDRSLRRWGRTTEPFFVEEEEEKRLESLFEEGLEEDRDQAVRPAAEAGEDGAAAPAGRRTQEVVTAADSIVEALELAAEEAHRLAQFDKERKISGGGPKAAPPNPLLLGLSPAAYVLKKVTAVRPSEVEQALMVLPFTAALELLDYIVKWLRAGTAGAEQCVRTASLLLRLHQQQLVATPAARQTLLRLQKHLRPTVLELKGTIGFNMSAMKMLKRSSLNATGDGTGEALEKVAKVRKLRADAEEGDE